MSYQLRLSGVELTNVVRTGRSAHLRSVTGPKQPMLIVAESPEYWENSRTADGTKNNKHTQSIYEEIILNFVDIPGGN